jgi:hypothetical protein
MNEEEVRITAYALGELDGPDLADLDQSLGDNPLVEKEAAEIRDFAQQLQLALREDEHRVTPRRTLVPAFLKWAAALLAAGGVWGWAHRGQAPRKVAPPQPHPLVSIAPRAQRVVPNALPRSPIQLASLTAEDVPGYIWPGVQGVIRDWWARSPTSPKIGPLLRQPMKHEPTRVWVYPPDAIAPRQLHGWSKELPKRGSAAIGEVKAPSEMDSGMVIWAVPDPLAKSAGMRDVPLVKPPEP